MQDFQVIIFVGTRTFGDIFKSTLVKFNEVSNFGNTILTNQKLELTITTLLLELLSIFFKKPITWKTHYLLGERLTVFS